jgi:hypothetical protein
MRPPRADDDLAEDEDPLEPDFLGLDEETKPGDEEEEKRGA